MAVSIFHRISGHALAFVGVLMFAWWLTAAATSPEAYATFQSVAGSWFGWILWVGLSWLAFQHLLSGVRHLLMDGGWGFDLASAQRSSLLVFGGAVLLTALFWALLFFWPGHR